MKRVIILIVISLFEVFTITKLPSPTFAQGTCICESDLAGTGACGPTANYCEKGYVNQCNEMYSASCGCTCKKEEDYHCGIKGNYACLRDGKYVCTNGSTPNSDNICLYDAPADDLPPFDMCGGLTDPTARSKCFSCTGDTKSGSANGVWTGLGCIRSDAKSFVVDFLNIALGVAGGIALLLMVYGAFLVSVSAGDPKKADEGKEVITGAIAGLLFIIFSVFLLKFIGVDILKIPGIS